ncbi:MAG TPA: hypothetical protein VFU24_16205 [Burkholderiales bacterium]|nr:hypothetical protein [Burkholderiales bacterium]
MKAILFAGTLAALTGPAAAQDIGMKDAGGIRWACGGAGVEERAALAALRPQANLELLFVTAKRGGYLADVQVALYAADNSSPVLQVTAEGPMCMIAAPAGLYRVDAEYGGVKRSARVTAGPKAARVALAFPGEPWDGIKASDEEKHQAGSQ